MCKGVRVKDILVASFFIFDMCRTLRLVQTLPCASRWNTAKSCTAQRMR